MAALNAVWMPESCSTCATSMPCSRRRHFPRVRVGKMFSGAPGSAEISLLCGAVLAGSARRRRPLDVGCGCAVSRVTCMLRQKPLAAGRGQRVLDYQESAISCDSGPVSGATSGSGEGVLEGLSTPGVESGVNNPCSGYFNRLVISSGAGCSGSSVSLAASC